MPPSLELVWDRPTAPAERSGLHLEYFKRAALCCAPRLAARRSARGGVSLRIGRDPGMLDLRRIIRSFFSAASIPCAAALGLVGLFLYPPSTHAAFALVALSLIPSAVIAVSESLLTAQERVDVVATLSVAENLARVLLWLGVLWSGLSTTAF